MLKLTIYTIIKNMGPRGLSNQRRFVTPLWNLNPGSTTSDIKTPAVGATKLHYGPNGK